MPQKRRNPPARYQLPAVVHPSSHKCFVIQVPNDIYHIAAFRGQLEALARAYTWGNDEAHTALDVASVWRTVIDNMESCMPALQFRQPNNCTLEVSTDGGFTWSPIFNSYNCALDAIAAEIANGTLQSGGVSQPPAGGTVPANECHTFHVVLQGNERWHSPVPVGDGYSIAVTNVKGGWSDGYAIGAVWQCPDGEYYSLGYCTGSFIAGYPGDPIPSLYHMRLIGHAGTYFDAYNNTYVVPNGTGNVDLTFSANDSDIRDNLGSIEFDLAICNYGTWCYTLDFRTSNYSQWATSTTNYTAGVGYTQIPAGNGVATNVTLTFSPTIGLTAVNTRLVSSLQSNGNFTALLKNPSDVTLWADQNPVSGLYTYNGNQSNVSKIIIAPSANGSSSTIAIQSITIYGTGVNPFGSSNC